MMDISSYVLAYKVLPHPESSQDLARYARLEFRNEELTWQIGPARVRAASVRYGGARGGWRITARALVARMAAFFISPSATSGSARRSRPS